MGDAYCVAVPSLGRIRSVQAARALAASRPRSRDVAQSVRVAFEFRAAGIRIVPQQIPAEISAFLDLCAPLNPKSILEVGTDSGGTLFLLSSVADPSAKLVSVDLFGYPGWKAPLYASFARGGQSLRLIRGDSHSPETIHQVKGALGDAKLDLLFLDGDHSYAGVKKDFETYSPMVREGGIIALHDIVPTDPRSGAFACKFWAEVKEGRKHTEIVENWGQGAAGIGLLYA